MNNKFMELQIFLPAKILYKSKVEKVSLKNKNGSLQIRKNHARFVSILTPGEIKFIETNTNEEKKFNIKKEGAVIEVFNNVITILLT